MRVCVITDNEYSCKNFLTVIQEEKYCDIQFDVYCSINNVVLKDLLQDRIEYIVLKDQDETFFSKYDLFLSLHSKQIFPEKLINDHTCINVHPGYNPYNRGWYPQVFSIMNGEPVGVTIHKMDCQIDHGAVLYQEKVEIKPDDTSYDVYSRIQQLECEMLKKYLPNILSGEYKEVIPEEEGSIHYKKDFRDLCKIDLNKTATYREVINHLRAMTFKDYQNAFFITDDGEKIYVSITLKRESDENK